MRPGVDSASKNEYRDIPGGKRRPERKGDDLTTFTVPKVMKNPETTFRIPKGLFRPDSGTTLPFVLDIVKATVSVTT
jgi:hypothetical protein